MQTVSRPDVSHYTYRVTWSSEDDEFVAACVEFPSLSWLASSQMEALTGLDDLIAETVADMQEQGETVPPNQCPSAGTRGNSIYAWAKACTADSPSKPQRNR